MKMFPLIIKTFIGIFIAYVLFFFIWIVLTAGCVHNQQDNWRACGENSMTDIVRDYYGWIIN